MSESEHPPQKKWGENRYNEKVFRKEAQSLLSRIYRCANLEQARVELMSYVNISRFFNVGNKEIVEQGQFYRVRECAEILRNLFGPYSETRTGFSVAQAMFDLSRDIPRTDLSPAFYAEMIHLICGVEGRAAVRLNDARLDPNMHGRARAVKRSENLDNLAFDMDRKLARFKHGLTKNIQAKRRKNRDRILGVLGGTIEQWNDWHWQVEHVIKDAERLASLMDLSPETLAAVEKAVRSRIPFGVTPFYLSLMDDQGKHDRALRAQVLPPLHYVEQMTAASGNRNCNFDFMGEGDTSPVNLVTRRYPNIVILKPFNSCPQICVYCQRNWEIDQAMAPDAMASDKAIRKAIQWIADHPAIKEVLITGGDPMVIEDEKLEWILDQIARTKNIERIRIGTRTLVTVPMRITENTAAMLAKFRVPGQREICVVTHVQHPYEINPDMVAAVERLRMRGMSVFNQFVYTFFTSRRFEAVMLRKMMRLIGITPYYTFNAKGKKETQDYRVPLSRLLQEQKEESRLVPGMGRTDKAVYNVPRLGKSTVRVLKADLLTIKPDGSRVYEWHSWEKNITIQEQYLGEDVPILEYLQRLHLYGENPADYRSIWYYF